MLTYYVAWWNLENLFAEQGTDRRSDKLARALGDSIVGWTAQLRDTKIGSPGMSVGHSRRLLERS